LLQPARWTQPSKLDDTGSVWDFLQRLERASSVRAHDIGLTAESANRQQSLDYSGAVDGGFDAAAARLLATRLQELVGGDGSLRMTVGSLSFPTGQALLDWLKATGQPFNAAKVSQTATPAAGA